MVFPRLLHLLSTVDPTTGCVHLQRLGPTIVPHLQPLLLAMPCNHMVFFTCEISRWVRQLDLWMKQHPGAAADHPSRPRLPLVEDLAADAADYALKYATKAETMQGSMAVLASAVVLSDRQDLRRPQGCSVDPAGVVRL
jgi:hypothetical protein